MVEGVDCDLAACVQLVASDRNAVDEEVVDVVDEGVLVVALGDQFQHVLVVLLRQVQPDYVQAVVQEGGEDAGLGVAVLGGDEDVVWVRQGYFRCWPGRCC